ncbi:Harpin-induced protein 1 [Musa troglodytarum]|uniref:Harpin-induced protein 1 n=1 Tax=Musa troglodytarum TaxID=320322 RepID=A0A9E7G9J8_9LILI|nr:Harpin-induced protein 1 [Musa troglodytarum]
MSCIRMQIMASRVMECQAVDPVIKKTVIRHGQLVSDNVVALLPTLPHREKSLVVGRSVSTEENACLAYCGRHRSSCCGCNKCSDCCDRRTLLIAAWAVGAFVLVVLLIVVIVWLVLRPIEPRFHLKNTTVYKFNLSLSDNILSAVAQATVSFHNPDGRVGVYYDGGDVHATYQDQQITLPPAIPPVYQGHDDIDVWSPVGPRMSRTEPDPTL